MRYDNPTLLAAIAMNGNGSAILDLRQVINLSLQFTVTNASSPTGTVAITFANDCVVGPNGVISGGNFGTDSAAAAAPTVTANGTNMWNMSEVGHQFVKVAFTAGTGNGNLTVVAGIKGA